MFKNLILCAFLLLATKVLAVGECIGDHINMVVVHSDDNIYFTSELSCPSRWCMIGNRYSDSQKAKIYQGMMVAKENGTSVSFAWDGLNTPSTSNADTCKQATNQISGDFAQPSYVEFW